MKPQRQQKQPLRVSVPSKPQKQQEQKKRCARKQRDQQKLFTDEIAKVGENQAKMGLSLEAGLAGISTRTLAQAELLMSAVRDLEVRVKEDTGQRTQAMVSSLSSRLEACESMCSNQL